MSDDAPRSKRQRTESENEELAIVRSNYWFKEGDIVLQAENSQFRVHSSMLSRHSEVFADMFTIPQPRDAQEPLVEKCPVVVLSDKAEDVSCIMSIFYDNFKLLDLRKAMPFKQVEAMLCLGRKYGIDYVKDEALSRLHHDYPKTLEAWDKLWVDGSKKGAQIEDAPGQNGPLNLANATALFSIMPAAYAEYVLNVEVENIMAFSTLSGEMFKRCVVGRDRIVQHVKSRLIDCLENPVIPSVKCEDPSLCKKQRTEVMTQLTTWDAEDGLMYVLREWEITEPGGGLCDPCRFGALRPFFEKTRQELWDALPSFFNLPSWQDLKDEDL